MKNTRRQFLAGCSTLALAVSVEPIRVLGGSICESTAPSKLSLAAFSEQLNTDFHILQPGKATACLRLVEAVGQPNTPPDCPFEQFSLRFEGRTGAPLEQDTFDVEQARLGRLKLFLVPSGDGAAVSNSYCACFAVPASRGAGSIQLG